MTADVQTGLMGPILGLAWRELARFFRQRTRLIGAIGQPTIFWVLFGSGLGTTFQAPAWAPADLSYQLYFLPGVTALIILFTAIFSTISIIEDRRDGFLQGVLVAPVSRLVIVAGKLLGGTGLALTQVGLFLVIAIVMGLAGIGPAVMDWLSPERLPGLVLTLLLLAYTLTGLGYVLAWPMESTQGFHAIMSVFLMPMWLLSGAFFPPPPGGWLYWVMKVNPLSYGVAALQRLMFATVDAQAAAAPPPLWVCWLILTGFAAGLTIVAVGLTSRPMVENAR